VNAIAALNAAKARTITPERPRIYTAVALAKST
jgi:hypothetical protein